MKRIILALAITASIALSGCARFKELFDGAAAASIPVDQITYDTVRSSYGVAISLANGYRDTCVRRLIAPTCRTVVRKMQEYDARVYPLVRAARGDATYLGVALAAVNEFKAFQAANGVQ